MKFVFTFVLLVQVSLLYRETSAYYLGSIYYGGYEFAYFNEGEDTILFWEAQNKCPVWRSGAFLAKSINIGYNKVITEVTAPGYYQTWLGGHDTQGEGYWKWIDGSPITWFNWAPGEPNNNSDEDCLGINYASKGNWNDHECDDDRLGYVCQVASNRAMPFDHSELVFSDALYNAMRNPVNYWQAKARCLEMGSRLVQAKNDASKKILRKKLGSREDMEYWIDAGYGDDRCAVLDTKNFQARNCNEPALGFICESVLPHNLQVSDHHPTAAELEDHHVECTASGFPLPNVSWYKDDELVPEQSFGVGRSTLGIKQASTADAGRYFCYASNTVNGTERKVSSFADVEVISGGN